MIDYSVSGIKVLYQRVFGNCPEVVTIDYVVTDKWSNKIVGIHAHDIDGYEINDLAEAFTTI